MSSQLSLSHFTDEETEAQRGDGAGLKSHRACGRVKARALQGGLGVTAAHAGHESARVLVGREPSGMKSPPPPSGFMETILSPVRAGEALCQVCVALRGNRPRAGIEMCSGAGRRACPLQPPALCTPPCAGLSLGLPCGPPGRRRGLLSSPLWATDPSHLLPHPPTLGTLEQKVLLGGQGARFQPRP